MKQLRLLLIILIYSSPVLAQKQQKVYGDAVLKFVNTNYKYYMVSSAGDTVLIIDPVTGKITTRSKSGVGGLQIDQEGNVTNSLTQSSYGNGSSRNAVLLQRQSRGTISSPNSATVAGDVIGAWQAQGNTGSGFSTGSYVFLQAAEDWKDTGKHAGTNMRWQMYGSSDNGAGGRDTASRDRIQYNGPGNYLALIPIGASYNFDGGVVVGRSNNQGLGRLAIGIGLANQTGLNIFGASGQTANLFQLLNSTGTVLAFADANGNIDAPNLIDSIRASGDSLSWYANGTKHFFYKVPLGGSITWGSISGTLSNQTDLQSALNGKASITHTHAESDITNLTTDLAGKQALDADLTAIAALIPTANDVMQYKAGAWTNRSISQLKTDLALTKADVGLGSVENTALSTWAGSTNINTVGTIGSGTWQGSTINTTYIDKSITINAQTGTTYTLQASDLGKIVQCTNASAITVTLPSGLGASFWCIIKQGGAGAVTLAASGTTIHNRQSYTKTAGQYASFIILPESTSNNYSTQGDMQ